MRAAPTALVLLLLVAGCQRGGGAASASPSPGATPAGPLPSPSPSPGMRFQLFRPLAQATAIGGLAATGDGSAWFTEVNRNAVGRLSADGHYTEYPLPQPDRQ